MVLLLTKKEIKVSIVFVISCQNEIKKKFYILYYISEDITLVQFMDTIGNVNHSVSIYGCWIYDFNYKSTFPLMK